MRAVRGRAPARRATAGAALAALAALLPPARADAQAEPSPPVADAPAPRFSGELGIAASGSPQAPSEAGRQVRWLPYVYGDLGPLFARVDTFGARLFPLGAGSLELVARVSDEGREASPTQGPRRPDPRPWGLGTFQETRWGGFFADAFVDLASGGRRLEGSWVAELRTGPVAWYPQLGFAHRDARYRDALAGRPATSPGGATTPTLALSLDASLAPGWALVAHVERERLDASTASPGPAGRTRWLVALARSFD